MDGNGLGWDGQRPLEGRRPPATAADQRTQEIVEEGNGARCRAMRELWEDELELEGTTTPKGRPKLVRAGEGGFGGEDEGRARRKDAKVGGSSEGMR
jgi:hypothetical protein